MLILRYHIVLRALLLTLYLCLVGLPCQAASSADECCTGAAAPAENGGGATAWHADGAGDHHSGEHQNDKSCACLCACPCHTPATTSNTPLLRIPGQKRAFYDSYHASVLTSERMPPDHIPLA